MSNEIQLSENSKAAIVQAADYRNMLVSFTQEVLRKDVDFGIIPGVSKPSLLKPGSEKLINLFGLSCEMERIDKDFDLEKKFISYTYKATIKNKEGRILSQCEGSVNTYETKYRYTWVNAPTPQDEEVKNKMRADKTGRFVKNNGSWQWQERAENPDVIGLQNTIQKMAQKRAMVGAVLIATGASEFFTQDVEDMGFIDISHEEAKEERSEKSASEAFIEATEPTTEQKVNNMLKKEPQKTATYDEAASTGIKALIDKCDDQKSLVKVWNENPYWHTSEEFCNLMSKKKGELAFAKKSTTKTKKETVA